MKLNIDHIASLAKLPLKQEEKQELEKQLADTLLHVQRLQEINTDSVEETHNITGLYNITRKDIATASLSQKDALANAKHTENGFIVVNVILDQ